MKQLKIELIKENPNNPRVIKDEKFKQLGRQGYLIEYDPKYCQVIVDRMIALNPNIEILKNGKKYQL